MQTIPWTWRLLAKQEEFVGAREGKIAYVGGFGSGKTVSLAVRTFLLCNHIPRNRIIILRRSYRELYDSTFRTFMEWLPPDLFAGEKKSDDLVYIRDRNGTRSEVMFRSLNNPEKFKSVESGGVGIDEATEATQDEFNMLWGRRNRLPHVHYPSMYLTTNPCNKSHWLYEMFVAKAVTGETRLIQSSTYENRANLPKGYIEELEKTYPPDWIEMYLKGEFGITLEGVPVTPGFKPTNIINQIRVPWHVASKTLSWDKHLPLRRGWDPGRVRPACSVWQKSASGQWRKLWERLGHNIPGDRFIPLVKEINSDLFPEASWLDYMDPAGFQPSQVDDRSWFDLLDEHGIRVIRIPKTSPTVRADIFNKLLGQTTVEGQPAIVIDPACDIAVEAYRGGWHRKKPEMGKSNTDDPVKDGYYEHIADSDGYVFVGGHQAAAHRHKGDRSEAYDKARARAKSYH